MESTLTDTAYASPLLVIFQAQVLYKDYVYIISSSGYDFVYDRVLHLAKQGELDEAEYKRSVAEHDRIKLYLENWDGDFSVTELTPNASQIKYAGITWKRTDGRLINEARMVAEYEARKCQP